MPSLLQGSASAAADNVTIPTHQTDDLIVVFTYRDGSTTPPSIPAAGGTVPTFVNLGTNALTSNAGRLAYAIATGSTHTTGNWTNATGIVVAVLRGQDSGALLHPFIGYRNVQAPGDQDDTVPGAASSIYSLDGSSEVLRFYAHRTVTAWGAAPSGYTRQTSVATECCMNTKDDTTVAPASAPQSCTSSLLGCISAIVEIVAATDTSENPAFDAATTSNATAGSANPHTFNHTPVGAPRGVVVITHNEQASTDRITSVSYGGQTLAEIRQAQDTGSETMNEQLWFLGTGIPTGTQTVSISWATNEIHQFTCITFTANDDMEVIDSDEIQVDTLNPALTLSAGTRAGIGVIGYGTGNDAYVKFGNAQTSGMIWDIARTGSSRQCFVAYSAHATAGDHTLGWTIGNDDVAMVGAMLSTMNTFRPSVVLI